MSRSKKGQDEARYHHGDLRAALLDAAEAELRERGVEGFTLRGCAKRAGVSHAAPAHHFRDANALLTALAARGFGKFADMQDERQAVPAPDARRHLLNGGLAYVDFALENPELFRLMFASDRVDFQSPDLREAADRSFTRFGAQVGAAVGKDVGTDPSAAIDVAAAWAIVHGLANLILSGHLKSLRALPERARKAALAEIIGRSVPER